MFTVIVTAALAAAAPALVDAGPPTIIVEGFGSVKNSPDVAHISYSIQGEGKSSDEATRSLVLKSKAVEGGFESMDPAMELHSDSVQVQAVRGPDCKQDRYDEDAVHLSAGPCAIAGYVASQSFDVRTMHIEDAGTMVGLAGRNGATNPKIDAFLVADEKEAKREAIAAAIADARTKAQAIADASNARLGDVRTVNLDSASLASQSIMVTGSRMYAPSPEMDVPVTVVVKPAPVATTARVTVAFAIAQ